MTLWQNSNGVIYCDKHCGGYLAAAIRSAPKKKIHVTPLSTWVKLADAEAHHGCETCNPNWWKQ